MLSEADPVDVPQLTPEEMTAIISEAHKWKRKVAAHCHGDAAARIAIEAGVDSIEHGSFLTEDTLKLMKSKGVYLVPTRMAVYWVEKMRGHLSAADRRQGARRRRRSRQHVQGRAAHRRADCIRHRRRRVSRMA